MASRRKHLIMPPPPPEEQRSRRAETGSSSAAVAVEGGGERTTPESVGASASSSVSPPTNHRNPTPLFLAAQRRVLLLTWIAYVAFNIPRKIPSVSKSSLRSDLGLTPYELGAIDTAFLTTYTLGQFVSGPLGDRFGSKFIVSFGLIGSGICTILGGVASGSTTLIVSSLLHGFVQSGAWSASVKCLGPWLTSDERGTKMGLWSTCSPAGGVAGTAISTYLLGRGGWRFAFRVPGPALILIGVLCYALLVESPSTIGLINPDDVKGKDGDDGKGASTGGEASPSGSADPKKHPPPSLPPPTLREILRLPGLASIALGYFFLKFVRYLLLFWLPFYHAAKLGYDEVTSGYLSMTYEIGGVFGAVAIGWISDVLLGGRRTMATVWMTIGAAGCLVLYMSVGSTSPYLSGTLMGLIGILLTGPDSVLSGTICQDVGARSPYGHSIVGTVTGFVNGCGSVGTVLQGFAAAWVSAEYGWDGVFGMLVAFSALTATALVPALRCEAAALTGGMSGVGVTGGGGWFRASTKRRWILAGSISLGVGHLAVGSRLDRGASPIHEPAALRGSVIVAGSIPPFAVTSTRPYTPSDGDDKWPSCCETPYDLADLTERGASDPSSIAPNHRLLLLMYDVTLAESRIDLPPGMVAKLTESGRDVELFKTQRTVNVMNEYLPHETMSHNAVRSMRFGNALDAASDAERVKKTIDGLKCKPEDFCEPKQFVASDPDVGYVESDRVILTANMGQNVGSHGVIISKGVTNAMEFEAEDWIEYLRTANVFFEKSNKFHPERQYPTMVMDTFAAAGASQTHPHAQPMITEGHYIGKWEAIRRAAGVYGRDVRTKADGRGRRLPMSTFASATGNYFTDLAVGHASVGLAFRLSNDDEERKTKEGEEGKDGGWEGRPMGFVSLTAATGIELVFLARDASDDNVEQMGRLYHGVLDACYKKLGWTGVSTSCMFPRIGRDVSDDDDGKKKKKVDRKELDVPWMCRLAYRGSFFEKGDPARTADVSSNELFALSVVGSNVFEVARTIQKHLKHGLTSKS